MVGITVSFVALLFAQSRPRVSLVKSIPKLGGLRQVAFSRDGRFLAVASDAGFRVFDTTTWRQVTENGEPSMYVVASLGSKPFLTDEANGPLASAIPVAIFKMGVAGMALSNDGSIVATSGTSEIRLSSSTAGAIRNRIPLGEDKAGATRDPGDIVAAWNGFVTGFGYAWYIKLGHHPEREPLKGHDFCCTFAYAAGVHRLFSGECTDDRRAPGRVFVWDSPTSKSKILCRPRRQLINTLAVTSDGRLLALGYAIDPKRPNRSDRNAVYLMDGRTGSEQWSAQSAGGVRSLCFSRDGKLLAASNGDGTLNVYGVGRGR